MRFAKSMLCGISALGLAIGSAFAGDASLDMSGSSRSQAASEEILIAEPVIIQPYGESGVLVYELQGDPATVASLDEESWSSKEPTARNGGSLPRDPTPDA